MIIAGEAMEVMEVMEVMTFMEDFMEVRILQIIFGENCGLVKELNGLVN